ncbi:hypothetical protein AB0M29_18095 [Streptomyces sp. NPDC051976]|uniref:hypothetical protein n=1 Tax=Streptomyces sp. NPDC051976 TaxID=3154947 RepID=UPI00341B7DA1
MDKHNAAMDVPGGCGDSRATYLDKPQRPETLDLAFEENVPVSAIGTLIVKALLVTHVVTLPPLMVILVQWLMGDDISTALVFVTVALAMSVYSAVLFYSRVTEPVAEWRVLLDERRHRAADVFQQINITLRDLHSTPLVSAQLVRPESGQDVHHRLQVSEGRYRAYVTVFSQGSALYVGWTMWSSRRGYLLLGHFFGGMLASFAGQDADEKPVIRAERPRVMVEAVQLACLAGLSTAAEEDRSVAGTPDSPAARTLV